MAILWLRRPITRLDFILVQKILTLLHLLFSIIRGNTVRIHLEDAQE